MPVLDQSSPEHSVSGIEANTEFQESLGLNFKFKSGDNYLRESISSELLMCAQYFGIASCD